jgi:hypothetical protein
MDPLEGFHAREVGQVQAKDHRVWRDLREQRQGLGRSVSSQYVNVAPAKKLPEGFAVRGLANDDEQYGRFARAWPRGAVACEFGQQTLEVGVAPGILRTERLGNCHR